MDVTQRTKRVFFSVMIKTDPISSNIRMKVNPRNSYVVGGLMICSSLC